MYICIHSTQSQRSIRWGCGLSLFRPYLKVLIGYSGEVRQCWQHPGILSNLKQKQIVWLNVRKKNLVLLVIHLLVKNLILRFTTELIQAEGLKIGLTVV
ncbi:hypothetical protein SEENIN0B_01149 [Salmonella enterica subsp. enterica serovar Infantis str. SARB27]|uniref:Uncharacterized protein n=1 Tax=Salmonella enterica subsp. enterica serovar Infantis str. SARB27 TaxID=596155 RepID=A0A6C8G674_SALIN|nr:hypothetical protein SEENIN0B_01149 [Salmonella enterica subsp. enterica serovar Infantis str. SARB27]